MRSIQFEELNVGQLKKTANRTTEIDLVELFFALRKRWKEVLLTTLLGGVIAAAVSVFLIQPIYTSTSSVLILTKETTLSSLADLQMGSQLTNDYEVLITSRPVLEDVIKKLNLDLTTEELTKKITVKNPADTRILEISVEDTTPTGARNIVNELVDVSTEFIGDMMEGIPPKVIEEGVAPDQKTSPSNGKNTLLGLLLGFVLSAGVVTLLMLMDDTIKTEEDIARYLDLSTLASVPDRKDYINGKNGKAEKKSLQKRYREDR